MHDLTSDERLHSDIELLMRLSKSYSDNPTQDIFDKLTVEVNRVFASLKQNQTKDILFLSRVFHESLTLVEVAERQHRIRRWRAYRRGQSSVVFKHTCKDAFSDLLSQGFSAAEIRDALQKQNIQLVLTAHPTQAARRTLLDKYFKIAELLDTRDKTIMTPEEQTEFYGGLRRMIVSAWRSNTVRRIKPHPEDEARDSLTIIESTLWHILPKFMRTVDLALNSIGQDALDPTANLVSFGSWIGGDRDGNPYVTSGVTMHVLHLCRWRAAELIHVEIDSLLFDLSMTSGSSELLEAIKPLLNEDSSKWARATNIKFWRGNIPHDEPYRVLLAPLRNRCKVTSEYLASIIGNKNPPPPPKEYITSKNDILEPLLLCYRSLIETGDTEVANGALLDLIRRIKAFGLSLVQLDIRQESVRHTEALDAITKWLGVGSYANWSENERIEFLIKGLLYILVVLIHRITIQKTPCSI
jgi:phosphoenolpyruvate carboxylase